MASPAAPAALSSARLGVYGVFTLCGMIFASWAGRIPDIKAELGLSAGQLGVTLMAGSLGSLVGLPAAGAVAKRLGAARTCAAAFVAMAIGSLLVGLGTDAIDRRLVVAVGLFVVGLGMGMCDVAMNIEGAHVERLLGRAIMPRFHAAFSGGTVVAALIGAAMSALHIPVWVHLGAIALLSPAVGFAATGRFLPRELEAAQEPQDADQDGAAPGRTRSAWTEPKTLLIGVVVLVAAFTEGTANDWISVAFVEGHDLPRWAGVLAFAVFLGFMTLGRLVGTGLLDRFGRVPVLRLTLAVAVLGSLLVVFGNAPVAYAGAALWGTGVALGFPVGMSAAADDPERAHARVSVVATIGYLAFIAGPPFLGLLGDRVGVLRALLAVGALIILAFVALPAVREPKRPLAGG